MKILFVCLGNICRSPLAEGIFKQIVDDNGLANFITCDSAGTTSYHLGELADPRTRKNAVIHGLNLTHQARTFKTDDFNKFDYIIPMDISNFQTIIKQKPSTSKAKVILMREFDIHNKGASVPDPYHGDEKDFEEVFQILSRCCESFFRHIESAHI